MSLWKKIVSLTSATLLLASIHQASAAPRIVPIVSGQYLLGGAEKGKWIDAATTARQLRGGERYRIYTLAGQIGTSAGVVKAAEVICPETHFATFKPQPKVRAFVALGAAHNPLPRKPQVLNPNSAVYRQAVAEILRAQGIANPDVRITKIVRIDLEGDGVDEVVLSATQISDNDPDADAGDYSLVMLRKIINGKVQTIPIAENYYPKAEDFAAPSEFSIPAIADFNRDGTMEIMLNWSYYEGAGAELYTVQGSKLTKVLSSGCGA
jgi:hypothetical protein